jgi:GNAT superfamily N-acetyltransferase
VITYREATLDDVPSLARIRSAEWGTEAYWQDRIHGYLTGEHHPREALPPRVALVAADTDAIVGFAAGHLTRRFGCDGELEWLNVASSRRRTGVAAELLRSIAAWFSAHKASRVCVDVDARNTSARAFYRKHGAQDLNAHWLVWPDISVVVRLH